MENLRYRQIDESPLAYDARALTYLRDKYCSKVKPAVEKLRLKMFDNEDLQSFHSKSIDIELIYRQCFPMCIIQETYFPDRDNIEDLIFSFCLCKTLTLNKIDSILDNSTHDPDINAVEALDVNTIMCYSLSSLSLGIMNLLRFNNGQKAIQEIIKMNFYLLQCMFSDYKNCFNEKMIYQTDSYINKYSDPKSSRYLGSGFYESTIRATFAFYNEPTPAFFNELLFRMRSLRQQVDEIADVREDLSSGLLTLPVLLLLKKKPHMNKYIIKAWKCSKRIIKQNKSLAIKINTLKTDQDLYAQVDAIINEIENEGIFKYLYDICIENAYSCNSIISNFIGEKHDLNVIVDLKIAFLNRLKEYSWIDKRPKYDYLLNL